MPCSYFMIHNINKYLWYWLSIIVTYLLIAYSNRKKYFKLCKLPFTSFLWSCAFTHIIIYYSYFGLLHRVIGCLNSSDSSKISFEFVVLDDIHCVPLRAWYDWCQNITSILLSWVLNFKATSCLGMQVVEYTVRAGRYCYRIVSFLITLLSPT